jgi:hypothetical protein
MKQIVMRRVIDGKVYDTIKANLVCELSSSHNYGDFGWHETALYRTAKGRFFVAGAGGPRSMWAKPGGQNSWSGGEGIRAIDEDEARSHMEVAGCSAEKFIDAGLPVGEA